MNMVTTKNIQRINFWCYIEIELEDLKDSFEKCFNIVLYRDYEDTWEWLEDENGVINISRKHNWEQGLYDTELIISFSIEEKYINDIGEKLKNILHSNIYYGKKIYKGQNNYDFIPQKIWYK